MALQPFPNRGGIPLWPLPGWIGKSIPDIDDLATIDAVGESVAYIGTVWLPGGPGTSKVISSSGGKVWWAPMNTLTWANAATNLRIGIQDVNSATGLEDGTYDVQANLVPGTDSLTVNTVTGTAMESGTKTITHGDIIAVVIELTAKSGADTLRPGYWGQAASYPYCTVDTGAGPVKSSSLPAVALQFDDGTWGSLGENTVPLRGVSAAFNSSSNPDEYALLFQVPFKCAVNGIFGLMGEVDTTESFDLVLYEFPSGTGSAPSVLASISVDPDIFGQIAGTNSSAGPFPITEQTLEPGTWYAVAYVATSTGTRSLQRWTLADAGMRDLLCFGTNMQEGTRQNGSGAFSLSDTTFPGLGVMISKLDDGAGGAGGGLKLHPGMTGGMNG